ncbi:MAG: helix-turn-helix transcriptional regulator [Chloroflexi bacterium]|nr:helix-turn-helix transcriptional regulator [Chloroflexota bacterium]
MSRHQFSIFLERKFLEWQIEIGHRKSQAEFAKLIGVSRAAITMWLNGDHLPDRENAGKLAAYLGPEIYDMLGMPRPDPDLERLNKIWQHLPDKMRQAILKQGEKFVAEENYDEATKPVKNNI